MYPVFVHWLTYLFYKHFLNTYFVLGPLLGTTGFEVDCVLLAVKVLMVKCMVVLSSVFL